jgi:hypothetical protein
MHDDTASTIIGGITHTNIGRLALLYIPKTSHYFHHFFMENDCTGILWGEPENFEHLMQERATLRNNVATVIMHCLCGQFFRTR